MRHEDYVAEQMQDPKYRFWHRVYAPKFWIENRWLRLCYSRRAFVYRVCCWLVYLLMLVSDHAAYREKPLPGWRLMWHEWRKLRGELDARLEMEKSWYFWSGPELPEVPILSPIYNQEPIEQEGLP